MKKIIALIMTFAIAFIPMSADAAAKPGVVKFGTNLRTETSVELHWGKANNVKTYEVQMWQKGWVKLKMVKKTKKNKKTYTKKNLYKVKKVKKKYQVYIYKNTWVKKGITKKKTYTVKKLKKDTRYNFRVRGINGKKKGAFKKTSVTTLTGEKDMWFASKTLNAPYGKYSYLILKTTFRPNLKSIGVTSSNNNIVKVESLSYADRKKENISIKLNAKGDGNTTITVQGYKKTDTASVNVSGQNGDSNDGGDKTIALNSISITSGGTMEINDTKTLNVSFNPTNTTEAKKVTFTITGTSVQKTSSTDTSISIKAISAGSSTIRATHSNGKITSTTITVNNTNKLQYNYEFYKLKQQTIVTNSSEGTTCFLIKTKNPGTEIGMDIESENIVDGCGIPKRVSYYKNKHGTKAFYDIGLSDKDNNGYYYYLWLGHFKNAGTYGCQIVEYDASSYDETAVSSQTVNVKVLSYDEEYEKWLSGFIDYGLSTKADIMHAACNSLKNSATYTDSTINIYSPLSSLKLNVLPFWQSHYWNSTYLEPMRKLAKKLGATSVQTYDQLSGTDWENDHMKLWITFDGKRKAYSICPDGATHESNDAHANELTINDFETIGTVVE